MSTSADQPPDPAELDYLLRVSPWRLLNGELRRRVRAALRTVPWWRRLLWALGWYQRPPDRRTPAQRRLDRDLNLFAFAALIALFAGLWQVGLVIAVLMLGYSFRRT